MSSATLSNDPLTLALRELPARDLNRLASQLEAAAASLPPDDRRPDATQCRESLRRVQLEVTRRTRKAAAR
jgi:hypothetical protein